MLGDRLRERPPPAQPDYAGALEAYHRACTQDHALGCAQVGLMYQDGLGVQPNAKRASDL
jgi:TPR repeat protein